MTPSVRKTVLFVDNDLALLALIRELMVRFAGGAWDVLTAPDGDQALFILDQSQIDLLVADIRMPEMDGLQFLRLMQREHPGVVKVVLTGEATETDRAVCLGSGAELFLEKPRDEDGWRTVYAMLRELVKVQPEEGSRAVAPRLSLQDMLQTLCLARNSGIIEVRDGDQEGAVYLKDGQIIHAHYREFTGEPALDRLLNLAGEFNLKPFVEPTGRSLTGSWEYLLFEAARKTTARSDSEKETPSDETPFTRTHPMPDPPTVPSPLPVLDSPPEDLYVPQGGCPDGSTHLQAAAPDVEELLICSLQGEVLHEWHSPNTAGRVALLEYLSGKVRQLGQNLPLGEFDRLEVTGPEFRVVAHIQPDRTSFLRVTSNARGDAALGAVKGPPLQP